MATRTLPIALTVAGSDPSGGAGIQADLKTFAAFGVYGASVITALTAQNTVGVTGVMRVPQQFIRDQFEAVTSDLKPGAIKTGMLGDAETVVTVTGLLGSQAGIPAIVDPVMVATSGDVLLAEDAISAVRSQLLPRAALITPNLPEAARLLDLPVAKSADDMTRQGQALLALGPRAVLIKGGHGDGDVSIDVLVTHSSARVLSRPRVATRNTHGTGCTLSAAIAAGLAQGHPMADAVSAAKDYVWQALQAGAALQIGHGHGPVDHAFRTRLS